MQKTGKFGSVLSGAVLLIGLTAASAGTAGAAPLDAGIAADAPPKCFHTSATGGYQTVTVYFNNTCGSNQRIKFIIDRAADSSCNSIPAGRKGAWRSGGGFKPVLNRTVEC